MDEIGIIHQALRLLAGQCDGAIKRDMAGFNKFDAEFGRSLAYSDNLTPSQAAAALRMLQKYQRQLNGAGIILPESVPGGELNARIIVKNSLILLYFDDKPPAETRAIIKKCQGWAWHPDVTGKPWSVPVSEENVNILQAIPGIDLSGVNLSETHKTPEIPKKSDVMITRDGRGYARVKFPYDPQRVAAIKSLSDRRYDPDTKTWIVPLALLGEVIRIFPDAQIDDDLNADLERQKNLADLSSASESDFQIPNLSGTLFPFQIAGVRFLEARNGRAVIADDMGLGKTIQAIGYLALHPELRPALIVSPASVKRNWGNEIKKWMNLPEKIAFLEGRTPSAALPEASIYIIGWDVLANWTPVLETAGIRVMVADEAHYAKNMKSQRSRAFLQLAAKIERVIPMTGTPVTNRPAELFPLLTAVDSQRWSSWFKFAKLYCNARYNGWGWDFSGASNLEELHRVIKPYVLRRNKRDVLTDLPQKIRASVVMEFDPAVRTRYNRAIQDARERIPKASQAEKLTLIEYTKQAAVAAKLPAAIEWIENFIESGEKLIIFAIHRDVIAALAERFSGRCVVMTGDTPQNKRQELVDQFQTDENIRLFIGNIRAAGVGITLTAASNVAFLEFPWTPGDIIQAEDRCHRIGQTESVTAWYLIAEGTIDEDIVDLLNEKAKIIDAIQDGKPVSGEFGILDDLANRIVVKE